VQTQSQRHQAAGESASEIRAHTTANQPQTWPQIDASTPSAAPIATSLMAIAINEALPDDVLLQILAELDFEDRVWRIP